MEPYGWSHTHVRALVVVSRWAAMVTSLAGMGLELFKVLVEHSAFNIYQLNHTRDRQHICISPSVEALTLDVIKQGRTSALESEAQAFQTFSLARHHGHVFASRITQPVSPSCGIYSVISYLLFAAGVFALA